MKNIKKVIIALLIIVVIVVAGWFVVKQVKKYIRMYMGAQVAKTVVTEALR